MIEYHRLRDPQPVKNVQRHPTDDNGVVYQLIWAIKRTGDEEKEMAAVMTNLSILKSFAAGYDSVHCIFFNDSSVIVFLFQDS